MKALSGQRGVTLVELLVATAIASVTLGVLATAWDVIYQSQGAGGALVSASVDLQNASYWITQDAQMAATTDLQDGNPPVSSMALTWGGGAQTSAYSLSGTELRRNFNGTVRTLAWNVSSVGFSLQGRLITITVSLVPPGKWGVSQQSTFYVRLRPT
ncbi:MAG: prepilin-type N-terminal cleavage/methylation domain-containing protein [Chloroflexota bacterium]